MYNSILQLAVSLTEKICERTEAGDSSYAKSSVIVTGGAVSRQTVHDQILKMDVPESRPYEEHKQISQLHVYADEDHAHMQKPGKEKGKKNKSVPLVTVTEGTAPLSGGRNRTIRPMHFSDENFDTKNLWKTVGGYIARAYDTEGLEKIYIHGDGGGWIRNGLEEYPQSVHVMDGYHFFKELKRICRILPERNIRTVITNALRKDDRRKADLFLQELLSEPLTEKDAERIRAFTVYLFGEWNAIRRRILEDIPGSCTEGQPCTVGKIQPEPARVERGSAGETRRSTPVPEKRRDADERDIQRIDGAGRKIWRLCGPADREDFGVVNQKLHNNLTLPDRAVNLV